MPCCTLSFAWTSCSSSSAEKVAARPLLTRLFGGRFMNKGGRLDSKMCHLVTFHHLSLKAFMVSITQIWTTLIPHASWCRISEARHTLNHSIHVLAGSLDRWSMLPPAVGAPSLSGHPRLSPGPCSASNSGGHMYEGRIDDSFL